MRDAFASAIASILFLACTGPTVAQEIELIPELKQWEPVLGKWQGEIEFRESPTGDWKKRSGTAEIRSGGFFVELRATGEPEGQAGSAIEITGYDHVQKTPVSVFFNSDGSHCRVTSMGWKGTTLTVNGTVVTADREVLIQRSTWEYSPDFKSATGTDETFTDGEWWISRKIKSTKVE